MAIVLGDLGSVALGQQEYARARALYAESWALTLELQDQPGQVRCLQRVASLARAQGDHAQAISLFSAAEGLRVAIGGVLTPFERGEGERAISALREALDAEAFARAWLAGQELAPEEAVRRGLAGERMLPATRPGTLVNAAPGTTPPPPRSPAWQRCALPPAPPG